MGTQRGQMKEVLPWLVRWACRAGTREFCSALAALVGPVQHIFFLTIYTTSTAVLGRLSQSVCLWFLAFLPSKKTN